MHPPLLRSLPVSLDGAPLLARLASRPGTVVLRRDPHARLGWSLSGTRVLFDPLWSARADARGRWSFEGAAPARSLATRPGPQLLTHAASRLDHAARRHGRPGARLAGWIGFEMGSAAHDARHPVPAPGAPPDGWLAAYDVALEIEEGGVRLTVHDASALLERAVDPRARLEAALEQVFDASSTPFGLADDLHDVDDGATVRRFDRDEHRRAVERVQAHLRAGDSYQVNLTGFVELCTRRRPWDVFEIECERNPTGYAAHLHAGTHVVTSHSPELLLHLRAEHALTAPIKGTIAAGHGALASLHASAKDRAEHVMIVDLCRNDLGRHARPGSVQVRELMRPLPLRGLVHLVSEISADLPGHARAHAFADLFPGGSISGAPKRRSLQLLRDLERSGRGPYTGSVVYVDGDGTMDCSIAIRTALWQNGRAWFGCGGGIVLDSDPDREYEEAMLKAESFLASVRAALGPHPDRNAGETAPAAAPVDGAP